MDGSFAGRYLRHAVANRGATERLLTGAGARPRPGDAADDLHDLADVGTGVAQAGDRLVGLLREALAVTGDRGGREHVPLHLGDGVEQLASGRLQPFRGEEALHGLAEEERGVAQRVPTTLGQGEGGR